MELKLIFLLGFVVLCWISDTKAQDVTISNPRSTVTAPINRVADFFNKLGVKLPPKLRSAVDNLKIRAEQRASTTSESNTEPSEPISTR